MSTMNNLEWVKHQIARALSIELKGVKEKESEDLDLASRIYVIIENLIDQIEIDEEITEEEMWKFFTKNYHQDMTYWWDVKNHYENLQGKVIVEKPVIPKYIADFIKFRRGSEAYSLKYILSVAMSRSETEQYREIYDWVEENDELFARAWLDGYEVKLEKKYRITVSGHYVMFDKYGNMKTVTYGESITDEKNLENVRFDIDKAIESGIMEMEEIGE